MADFEGALHHLGSSLTLRAKHVSGHAQGRDFTRLWRVLAHHGGTPVYRQEAPVAACLAAVGRTPRSAQELCRQLRQSYGQQVPPLGQQKVLTSETQSAVQPSPRRASYAQLARSGAIRMRREKRRTPASRPAGVRSVLMKGGPLRGLPIRHPFRSAYDGTNFTSQDTLM